MSFKLQINTDREIYLKDPHSTELGKNIISESVDLIYTIGLEQFTFKKLADEIGSAEASIYRYFRNKIQLFAYLSALYWEWQVFRLNYHTSTFEKPIQKINKGIELLLNHEMDHDLMFEVDNYKLHRIIIDQGNKVFHTENTEKNNQEGFFTSYKKYANTFAEIISEINPKYPYPHILSVMVIESMYNQVYYEEYLPSLTDKSKKSSYKSQLHFMAVDLVEKVLT